MESRAVRRWTAALVLLCAGCLWLRFEHIQNTLPYPHDVDEGFVAGPATRTLTTGTFHPYTFNYPSLPKYLAAAGMAAGFLRGASRHEIREIRQIGNTGYPYYDAPRVVEGARRLFAFLSVVAMGAAGAAAWLAFRTPAAIFLTALALSTSGLFFYHSWTYLNVDIVGACFATLAVAACLHGTRRGSIAQVAVVPGVLAGLATGSKYTLAVVALPILLAIGIHFKPGRRLQASLAAITAMVAAFVAVVPYSLIDIPAFLNGVAAEAYHYSGGHPGFDGEPGLPQLAYYARHFASDFGIAGSVLAVVGACAYAAADWKRAIVLLSFPFALLWLLAAQRVHFERNVLSLHPVVAMLVAYGVICVHGWALSLARRGGWGSPRYARASSALVGLLLVAVAIPFWHLRDQLRDRTDSRNLAQAWIQEHLSPEWTIVVPTQLGFDARALESRGFRVTPIDFRPATDADGFRGLLGAVPGPAVILAPRWGADARFSGQEVANALNDATRDWHVSRTFGINPVLVNYSHTTPWGNPAFAIATLDRRQAPPR